MKHKLFFKFLFVYIAVAIASFILISTVISNIINQQLVDSYARKMYSLAQDISDEYKNNMTFNSENIYNNLRTTARFSDSVIMLIAPDGTKLVDTGSTYSTSKRGRIENFDHLALGTGFYTIGNFFGEFKEDMISVTIPLTRNMYTIGYVSIHTPMQLIYENREKELVLIHILNGFLFLIVLVIFILQNIWIYKPLHKIITGTKKMAEGNLSDKINIKSHDEMGYLAKTLNYMGDELNKQNEYQRKFIANVSHDFRSPLTSIKGYVEAIRDSVIPHEMMGKYLDIIVSETERLNKLTKEMLSLDNIDSRVRKMNYTSFNINKLIKDTVLSFEGICSGKGIRFNLVLEDKELIVVADYVKIQQVMYNLIDNAIKFSNPNSYIDIETSLKKDKAYIYVKDHGIGISNAEIAKIWQRFYKTDSSRGKDRTGTGLGLSIVKDIIAAHNQKITVVSTEGVGTEFYFTLDTK
jgi:signal transduction histidine kinase